MNLELIKKDIKDLMKRMREIDTCKSIIRIEKSNGQKQVINLENQQIIFRLSINNEYIQYISTKFIPKELLLESALTVLLNFLRKISGIETLELSDYKNYPEIEEFQDLQSCSVDRIYIQKGSNLYNVKLKSRFWGNYQLEIEPLQATKIVQVMTKEE